MSYLSSLKRGRFIPHRWRRMLDSNQQGRLWGPPLSYVYAPHVAGRYVVARTGVEPVTP